MVHKNLFIHDLLILLCGVEVAGVSAQTLDERVDSILVKMTLDEKILQLHAQGGFNTADNTRLGIPGFQMYDGPHGVRYGNATSFPVSIGMAATWDVDIIRQVGVALGQEFRGKGFHQMLVLPWIFVAIRDMAGAPKVVAKTLISVLR